MGKSLLFMVVLMCYQTTSHFRMLTLRGSCRPFKSSNTIFPQLIISLNHFPLYLLIIFPTVNLIAPSPLHDFSINSLISNASLAFTIVPIISTCSIAVLELALKMGIVLLQRTSCFFMRFFNIWDFSFPL